MRVLFDHNIPSGAARALGGHDVTEALQRGWDRFQTGSFSPKPKLPGLTFC